MISMCHIKENLGRKLTKMEFCIRIRGYEALTSKDKFKKQATYP
jgi:hypothetical protein